MTKQMALKIPNSGRDEISSINDDLYSRLQSQIIIMQSQEIPTIDIKYKRGQLIGKGTFGEVYQCLNLNTGELMAVKSVKVYYILTSLQ